MKKYTVVWLPEAAQDLYENVIFLSKVSIDAAFELREAVYNESQSLADFPDRNPLFEMTNNFPYKARSTVSPNRQNETEKQSKANIPNKTGNAVDQFEPLKSMYTTDELQLIRRVCAAFSQNSKPEERPIIEQIKKKVIKALGK